MGSTGLERAKVLPEQDDLLAHILQVVAGHYELPETCERLLRVAGALAVDLLSVYLYDPKDDAMRLRYCWSAEDVEIDLPPETPVNESPAGQAWRTQESVAIADVVLEPRWPAVTAFLRAAGMQRACVLPLLAGERCLGALELGSRQGAAFGEDAAQDLRNFALAVAIGAHHEALRAEADEYKRMLMAEHNRSRLVLEVNNALVSRLELHPLFGQISACLQDVVPHDYFSLSLYDSTRRRFQIYALDFPEGHGVLREEIVFEPEGAPAGEVLRTRQPLLVSELDMRRFPSNVTRWLLSEGIRSACFVPVLRRDTMAVLTVASLRSNAFSADTVEMLTLVAPQIGIALENALAFRDIAQLKDKLAEENTYLEGELRAQYHLDDMLGESPSWRRVLEQAATVAASDASVLLLGETGTGKELIARAIHNQSRRRDRPLVKVSCAAVPGGLLESELFGHEKGAFTGALTRQIGRFELADNGSLFLDEVGDISLELQPKLLRALQEQEFERLGNPRTIKVNVRVIAATNRKLTDMVAKRAFREDLYYRLNVFPILLPPLRERPGDIGLLASHFVDVYAARQGKKMTGISRAGMQLLNRYDWPGNVRELEHVIERAVILARGPVVEIGSKELQIPAAPPLATLSDAEREHILKALRAAKGVVGGAAGAAARLGLKRSTLNSRMRKLGISRQDM